MSYAKLFSTLLTSTVWSEADATRIVWITMLALANQHGEVYATIPGLARFANVGRDDCEHALMIFMSPDKDSRTPDDEGRRIEKIEGGWLLLNYPKYRMMGSKEDEKSKSAERVRRFRDKQKRNDEGNDNVTPCNGDVTQDRDIAEAEADTEAKVQDENVPPQDRGELPPGKSKTDFVLPFLTDEFVQTWEKWLKFRKEKKKPLTRTTLEMQLSKFAQWGEARSIRAMIHTMLMGWQGLREPEPRDLVSDPPSWEDVKTYGDKGGQPSSVSEAFYDRMTKYGWYDGAGPVIDWQAAFRYFTATFNPKKS